jgi:hypothetical protein
MHPTEPKQPFFARFLESQNKKEQNNNEQLFDPWPVPVPTKPVLDIEHTLKYPSDNDEY